MTISISLFANEEGMELHQQSCINCHIVYHDDAFYTREDRKIKTLAKLGGQVSRCVSTLELGWFPDEEQSVLEHINAQYYKFK